MAFLNETGLATFLSYLKAWARATFASKTDSQTIEGATTFTLPIAGSVTGSSGSCTGNAGTASKLATPRNINGVSFDGSANITVADSTKVAKSGDTMTGALNGRASNVNLAVEPSSVKEDFRFYITRNTADTVHTGNLMRLGVAQSANTKDYRIMLVVANPRGGNLPTQESIAGGYDDPNARTSNCWGGIGVYYDYSKNRAYPYCCDLDTCDPTDNSTQRLATNRWVRTATGNFACNAATASAFASSKNVTLTGAVTGTASSTGGWTVSTVWRSCLVGRTDSGTSNPWYKVATRLANGASSSYNITFYVENASTSYKHFGILRVSVSTNSSKIISSASTKFAWLVNDGFNLEDFVLVCPATAEPTVELWTKLATGYLRRRFVVISEGYAGSTSTIWTLLDASSAGQSASITTEGTQIVSSASSLEQRVKALEEAMR